jgi:putative endonuclease
MMKKRSNLEFGYMGENRVAQYLEQRGFLLIEKNWRISGGEIDLILRAPDGRIIFTEVKARTDQSFGHPLEAITSMKAKRMRRLALAWLVVHNKWGHPFRIDAAAVIGNDDFIIDYREGVA